MPEKVSSAKHRLSVDIPFDLHIRLNNVADVTPALNKTKLTKDALEKEVTRLEEEYKKEFGRDVPKSENYGVAHRPQGT